MTSQQESAGGRDVPPVTVLPEAECWLLLGNQSVGRLGMIDEGGEPEVLPVNYLAHEGLIYLRSAHGGKLRNLRRHPTVALEIDGSDGDVFWSVLVRGAVEEVVLDEEIRLSGAHLLHTESPVAKPFTLRITPAAVTGRRFRGGNPPAPDAGPGAAGPPHPIPGRRPWGE